MKKGAIITAIILLTLGLLLFVVGLSAGGSLKPITYETKTYPVAESFTNIRIDTHDADIRIAPSTDGTCSAVCSEAEKIKQTVSVQDGTLTVMTVDERTWVDRLFPNADQIVLVYLPQSTYANLEIDSHTGDTELPNSISFERISITCSTGDVKCAASAVGKIEIKTSTGGIALENVKANALALTVTTGNIKVNNAKINNDVFITISTGGTEVSGLSCDSLTTTGSTGRVTLKECEIAHALWIERSTGDVRFENCDAESITVQTHTGDVSGMLRSEMDFVTKTDTGRVHVPDTHGGGRCEITTDTGDIDISLANAQKP